MENSSGSGRPKVSLPAQDDDCVRHRWPEAGGDAREPRPRDRTSWTAEDWCRTLAERFFTERSACIPVLFFVDEEVLAEIYGGNAAEATDSITELVRRHLCSSHDLNGYFFNLEREGRRWRIDGGDGMPPFLHALAVCVLAATRMGTGSVAKHAYYFHLRELLGLGGSGTPAGFDQSFDLMWGWYSWWLNDKLGGQRGLSTVVENASMSHIGRPISQTLFRRSDARQLYDFFRWIELDPGEDEIAEDVLVTSFRAWAPAQELSPGARRLLQDEQFWPTLGRILAAYARNWDGTRAGNEGGRCAALRVVVRLRPLPASVSVESLQPEGYPERLFGHSGGWAVTAVADDGVFVIQGAVGPQHLLKGMTLGDAAARLALAGSELVILRIDEDLGGWGSVASFTPGERHFVLAAPSVAADVEHQLGGASSSPITARPAPGGLPGWMLYGDVVLQGNERFEGALASSRSTIRHRFDIRGGLPLRASASYLTGGAPDVWLPPDQAGVFWLTIDGKRVDTLAGKVRLADHLPKIETNAHLIAYGDALERRISIFESQNLTPPTDSEPGHLLEIGEDGEPTSHKLVGRAEDASVSAVTIVGPHVRGGTGEWSSPPVMLRRDAAEAWLIGAVPGEVLVVEKPAEPRWMKEVRLSCHLYEAPLAPFEIQYSIERWRSGAVKASQRAGLEPGEMDTDQGARKWVELLLEAELTRGDEELWAEYRTAAELLAAEAGS